METTNPVPAEMSDPQLDRMLQKAKSYRRGRVSFKKLSELETELRYKRKALLGSNMPLTAIVGYYLDGEYILDIPAVVTLSEFLSSRTCAYWSGQPENGMQFCRQFFNLGLIALADPKVSRQCLDDLILLSHALVCEPKEIYEIVMRDMLKEHHHSSLNAFLAEIPDDFHDATFEQSVLAAVSIFLGALADPVRKEG